jgi:outer membrane protein TolC
MKRKRAIIVWVLWVFSIGLRGQVVFSLEQVLSIVRDHHPMMYRASLVEQSARGALREARGAFDPEISSDFQAKEFKNTSYYTLWDSKLKIPTWYGVHVFGGYEWHRGDFLDPSRTVPEMGLPAAGLGVTVLKGLIMDERRAVLRQAQAAVEQAGFDRIRLENRLYLRVVYDYWDWAYSWQENEIFNRSVALAKEQLNIARILYKQGDIAAVDTLEAYLQWQNRVVGLNQANLNLQRTALQLANHLWREGRIPVEPDSSLIPLDLKEAIVRVSFTPDSLQRMLLALNTVNPEIRSLEYGLEISRYNMLLKKASLLPTLDLNYNFLYAENGPLLSTSNYKAGIYFKAPILFRKERGAFLQAKAKLSDVDRQLQQLRLELRNQLEASYLEYETMLQQVELLQSMEFNFNALYSAEKQRFENGETTVFLMNARELALMDSRIRLADMQRRALKSEQAIYWAFGLPLF